MQEKLLTAIIKSNLNKKKTIKELIDDFISSQGKMVHEHLEEFLSSLLVYIHKNHSLDQDTLLPLINSKLQDLNIPVNTSELETIYATLAATHMPSAKFEFDKVDVKAVEMMRKGFYWAGVEYNEKTQDKLKNIIEGAFQGEHTRAELAAKLKEEFTGVLNASTSYFEGVADHIINQSQNISKVNQALKYDVKHFKVEARIDAKTSAICRSMHGKIIEATHLSKQVDNVLAAKTISEKKEAAAWRGEPLYGKLPSNFGLPPYHFRCRTEVIPVWLSEEEIEGKKVKYASKKKDDIITHIDKTGVQRRADAVTFGHSKSSKSRGIDKKGIISALNSITEIATHSYEHTRTIAKSANGYILMFEADYLYTAFKPDNFKGKSTLDKYFKQYAKLDKKEVIKWNNTQSTYQIHGQSRILKMLTKILNSIK